MGRQAAITQALLAQQGLDLAFVDLKTRTDCLVHIDFQKEVHTARQVQTQLHRTATQVAQPVRRGLRQVKRHHIVVPEGTTHDVLGRQLISHVSQAQQAATRAQFTGLDADTRLLQGTAGALQIRFLDLQRRAVATDLDSRIIRIQVGCRINKANHQHRQDQQVFPQRKLVEHATIHV